MRYFSHTALILLILTIFTACGGDKNKDTPAPNSSTIASVTIASGNNQTAAVGTELPVALVTVLLNSSNKPIPGQVVTFKVATGAGTVFSGTTTSDANGVVRERWTLGTAAGIQKLELKALTADGSAVVIATFFASAVAAAPKTFAILKDDYLLQQRHPLSLRAIVLDSYGNPVIGLPVNFTASDGSISSPTVNTDTTGQAATIWTIGNTVGTQTFSASAAGLDKVSIAGEVIQAPPGAPVKIEMQAGDLQTASQYSMIPLPVQVRVSDAYNIPVPGVTVTFTTTKLVAVTVNNATQIDRVAASDVTDAQGIGSWRGFLNSAGQQTIDATVAQLGPITFSVNVVASAHTYDGHYLCANEGYISNFTFDILQGQFNMPQLDLLPPTGTLDEATGDMSIVRRSCFRCTYQLTGKLSAGTPPEMTASGTSVSGEFNLLTPAANWSCKRE